MTFAFLALGLQPNDNRNSMATDKVCAAMKIRFFIVAFL